MRYLGLDVGNRRIGVAVGSTELQLATPLAVIQRKRSADEAIEISSLIRKYQVDALVVGLPRNADGTEGEQARKTREFVDQLTTRLALPVVWHDERYSTVAALNMQRQRGVSEKRGRGILDASAAAVILQDFLDTLNPQGQASREGNADTGAATNADTSART